MTGIELIAAERSRQLRPKADGGEGYGSNHDAGHEDELALAGACYALPQDRRPVVAELWPWEPQWWKPTPEDRVRELTKAGALIAAAIDAIFAALPSRSDVPQETLDRNAALALALRDWVNSLRSPRNSLGKLALPKGPMERAVEDAWETAQSWVGDPADGIVQTSLSVLADAICDALIIRLAAAERTTPVPDTDAGLRSALRERLAAIEHDQWVEWSQTIVREGLTDNRITRWAAYWRPYDELDEATKDHDRQWADKVLAALQPIQGEPEPPHDAK